MAVEIGALRALLSLDSAAFERGAKRAQASMGGLQRRLTKMGNGMRKFGRDLSLKVSLPIAGAAGLAVRSSLQTVDAQAKMAQSLGTTTKAMQIMTRASELAGISSGELEQISRQLTKRLSQAAGGAGPAAKALGRLGLRAEDLVKLDLDQQMLVINRAIEDNIPLAERAAVAAQIFGDRAGLLASRLDAATIARANEELERFGVTVTDIEADEIEAANDAMSALSLVTKGLANQLTVALAPTLQRIAERLADWGAAFADLSPQTKRIALSVAGFAAALGPVLVALGFMAAGLAALLSPVGAVIVGLAAAAGAAAWVASNWDKLVEKFPALGVAAERLGDALSVALDSIKAQFRAAMDVISGVVGGIGALFRGDFASAVDEFRSALSGVGGFLSATVDGWLGIFDALLPGFRETMSAIASTVTEFFAGLPAQMVQVGRDIIDGIKRGILQKWEELKETILALGSGLPEWIKGPLGIQSPSRVFMEIGRDLMAGLGIGISENAGMAKDALTGAADRISGSLSGLRAGFDETSSRFGDMVADLVTGSRRASDVLSQLGNQLIRSGINGIVGSIFGGAGGGLLGGLLSFDGGGFTGMGARSGGLDGKGGFLGVLHPRESVIDHTRADTARIMGGGARAGGTATIRLIAPEGFTVQQEGRVQGIALQVTGAALEQYDKETLPGSVERVQRDPLRVG